MTVTVILNTTLNISIKHIFRKYQNEKIRIATPFQVSEGSFLISLKNSNWQEYSR